MVRRAASAVFLAAAVVWAATAAAAQFTATVDRKALYADEHVLLRLALVNSETRLRAQGVDPNIDLTMLTDDFELGVPRSDFRFNIDRNRGRATSEITVELFPRRSGRLVIPAFSVDGLRTEPITLQVQTPPDEATPEVFARSGVGRETLWVREQTIVYLDLYHRINLAGARLGGAIDIEPRGVELHELPQADRTEEIDGLSYNVTRTAWALAPRDAGPITVYLPDIWIETGDGDRRRLPFREERLEARALPPDVPAGAPVGRPQLAQSTPEEVTAGALAPWEVTLRTPTALNTLPGTLPMPPLPAHLKSYTDTSERRVETRPDGSPVSTVVYRTHLMPTAAGTYELPPLDVPYFDTRRGRMALATLPGRTLHVTPAPASNTRTDPPAPSVANDSGVRTAPPADGGMSIAAWRTAAGVLLALWLATAALAWRLHAAGRRKSPAHSPPSATPPGKAATAKDRLLAALGTPTLEQGLEARERRHGPDPELRAAIRSVQRLCYGDGRQGEAELDAAVERAMARLKHRPVKPAARSEDTPAVDPWSPRAFYKPGNR